VTDRERYLILLSGLLRARHELMRPAASDAEVAAPAREELHKAVRMVKDGTPQAQFLADCAAAEEAVEVHGG
jgi:hypothetical protein